MTRGTGVTTRGRGVTREGSGGVKGVVKEGDTGVRRGLPGAGMCPCNMQQRRRLSVRVVTRERGDGGQGG